MLVRSTDTHVRVIFTAAEAVRLGAPLRNYFRSMCQTYHRGKILYYNFSRRRWHTVRHDIPGLKLLLPTTWQNI